MIRFDVYSILRYYSGFGRCDDDFVDRLSRHYSVLIFSVFVLIVSSVQFVGKPISCFTPASFTTAHITYADFVCWISDTYFVSIDTEIPETHDLSETRPGSHLIRFYQYVPFILMLQTCGFFLPGFFWRSGCSHLGLSLQKYLDRLKFSRRSYAEPPLYRRQLIRNVATRLDQFFRVQQRHWLPRLTLLYLSTKIIYLLNILLQIFSLHYLMHFDFNMKDLLERFLIYSNTVRHASLQFPTNVLCDFIVRFLGKNKHRHTVQCVLPINVFNEKIFIFAYLWLFFLLICTLYNIFIQWILFFLCHRRVIDTRQRRQRRFLSKSILDSDQDSDNLHPFDYQPITKNFSRNYLRSDGLVVMRLFDINTDLVTMNDLMDDLWELYRVDPL
jgi:innexin